MMITATQMLLPSCIVFSSLLLPLLALASAADHCDGTLYPELCASTLATIPDLYSKSLPDVICATINTTETAVRSSAKNCTDYLKHHSYSLDTRQRYALDDCLDLFSQTIDELVLATSDLEANPSSYVNDVRTVLSAAITNQFTCLDGFAYVGHDGGYRRKIEDALLHVSRLVSNSLAMTKKIHRDKKKQPPRREALEGYGEVAADGFPTWVSKKDRRLLQAAVNATKPDLTVAQDGTGNFTTVSAAVAAAPSKSKTRFVIYIKAGAYMENVEVDKSKTNLLFMGDGIGKTVVKASRNVVDGWTTFRSATVGN